MADSIWDVIFGENRFEPNRDFDIFGYKDEYAPPLQTNVSIPFYEQERQYKTLPQAPDITIDPFRFNVYKPISTDSLSRHGNVSVPMTLQGIMQSFTGGLDTSLDAGGSIPTTATEKPLEDVGVMDFNVYNAYKGQHAKQPFTEAFKEANLFALPRETEQKMREYSGASDLFKFGGNIASGGLAFKTLTNKVFSDAVNFGVPGLTFDLEDPNFGQIFQELGADGEFVNWLAGDGKNETAQARIEQRLKNALTETGLGYLFEQGVRIVRNAKELFKNPEYRDKVIDETFQPLVDQRSPTERINESLYNITALNNDNRHLVNIAPSPGIKMGDDQPTRELAPVDEGGYFMKSAQVLMDDPREIYKQPSLLAQVNKKGEIVGELVNKGVKVDELKESGLLGYLNTKQHLGEPVTKQELLDFIETNRPKIEPHISFHSDAFGSNIEIPNIPYVRDFAYNPDTGKFADDVDDLNFKIVKPKDDPSFNIEEETEKFRLDFTYADYPLDIPSPTAVERDKAIGIFLKELGFDAGILNKHKFKEFVKNIRADEFQRNVPPSQQKSVGRMEHLIREEFNISESDYNNALEQIATKLYYQNPKVQWDVPVKTDIGTIQYKVFSYPFGNTTYGDDYIIKVERPGHEYLDDVGYVSNFADISVKIRDNAQSILGGSDDSVDTLLGTSWGQYVQGNTDMNTYREVAVNLNPKNYEHPDIKFHAMAGKTSADTRNMLGHLRIDNRVDKQGRKHTHSLEHQSDWSQKAREYGVTDAEHKTKRENANTVLDKAFEHQEEVKKIKNDAEGFAINKMPEHNPYDSTVKITQEFLDSISRSSVKQFQELVGLEIDKPMIDQYIARLKKFVVDEGMDDEVGAYMTTDIRGNPQKRILDKASMLKNTIEGVYGDISNHHPDATFKLPTADEIVQRFKNGNPSNIDLHIAIHTGHEIQNFFNDAVNTGSANMSKLGTFKKVMGSEEVLNHQGKVVTYQTLNQFMTQKIWDDLVKKRRKDIEDFAKNKGVKGSLYELESKINRNVEKAKARRNRLYDYGKGIGGTRPPLIHKDRHVKLLLKELIKQGIKDNSDVVSWTPSQNQIDLWGEGQAQLFKNTYDKDSKNFGNEILKDYGLDQQVQTKGATIDYGTHRGSGKEQGERDVMYIELTPELKQAVLNEEKGMKISHDPSYNDTSFRQPLYAIPPTVGLFGMEEQDSDKMNKKQGLLE